MSIMYDMPTIEEGATQVEVTFRNQDNQVYKKILNVPYVNGVVDQEAWLYELEKQLNGVVNYAKKGKITFTDEV